MITDGCSSEETCSPCFKRIPNGCQTDSARSREGNPYRPVDSIEEIYERRDVVRTKTVKEEVIVLTMQEC